jgi:hypothetical protein
VREDAQASRPDALELREIGEAIETDVHGTVTTKVSAGRPFVRVGFSGDGRAGAGQRVSAA